MKILMFTLLFSLLPLHASAACTIETQISGIVGPATLDLVERLEKRVREYKCESALLTINTPGGSLETTRYVVERILNFPVPVLCLVAPEGAHAGSAGAIILQACHVNGALSGTNLGAATPIQAGGQEIPKDLRQKILNDTRSWLDSITKLRGRNEQFGRDIIMEAKAVSAEEAFKLKAIDFAGGTKQEFLKFAEGRDVKLAGTERTKVKVGDLQIFSLDVRHRVLSLVTDPEIAYLLLLGSLGLLYFEFTHPGMIAPGVVGGLGLVISLVALHKLNVEWGGLILIFLGIAMLIAELFVTSFGALGVGGIIAFVLGSLFLFDPVKTGGFRLPLTLILPVAILFAAIFLGVGFLLLRTRKVRKKGGFDELINESGKVVAIEANGRSGMIEILGETWKFESVGPVMLGQKVKVTSYQGLKLNVQ